MRYMGLSNFTKNKFSKHLKNANVTPVFKDNNPLLAKNFRPVSVLQTPKTLESTMENQIINYIN